MFEIVPDGSTAYYVTLVIFSILSLITGGFFRLRRTSQNVVPYSPNRGDYSSDSEIIALVDQGLKVSESVKSLNAALNVNGVQVTIDIKRDELR